MYEGSDEREGEGYHDVTTTKVAIGQSLSQTKGKRPMSMEI